MGSGLVLAMGVYQIAILEYNTLILKWNVYEHCWERTD